MRIKYIMMVAMLFAFAGCQDLEVVNPNNPDSNQVLGNPEELPNVVGGVWNTWYYVESGFTNMVTAGMADQITGSMNNWNMNQYTSEPRVPLDNAPTAANNEMINNGWDNAYSALGGALDVLKQTENQEVKIMDGDEDLTPMVRSNLFLLQGLNYGFIANAYDRAFMVDETIEDPAATLTFPESPNYDEVLEFALSKIDKSIAIFDNSTFTIPGGWLNTPSALSSSDLSKIANSYAARFLVNNARTSAENSSTDWERVKTYAENGLTEDFLIVGTGFGTPWVHQTSIYGTRIGWCRVDQRIVSLLDPSQPKYYPKDGTTDLGPMNSDDARADTDFAYLPTQWANPERGLEHYSNHIYRRLGDVGATFTGPHPFMRKAERDLILAEAIVRTDGPNQQAADLINNSRVGRGQLTPISATASADEMLEAIFYERDIELMMSGALIAWTDGRRRDALQSGTATMLPVPGKELELLLQPIYTYPSN